MRNVTIVWLRLQNLRVANDAVSAHVIANCDISRCGNMDWQMLAISREHQRAIAAGAGCRQRAEEHDEKHSQRTERSASAKSDKHDKPLQCREVRPH